MGWGSIRQAKGDGKEILYECELNVFKVAYKVIRERELPEAHRIAFLKQKQILSTPKKEESVITGHAKVLKHFSTQKYIHVLGGRIEDGVLKLGQSVRILRREIEVAKGMVKNLQQQKSDVKQVNDGEFGMQIYSKNEIAPGDIVEGFEIVVS